MFLSIQVQKKKKEEMNHCDLVDRTFADQRRGDVILTSAGLVLPIHRREAHIGNEINWTNQQNSYYFESYEHGKSNARINL